ncbi:glycosyltransferase family 9 protein [Winogradskyella sp.]|uniref:glycosyltransferase family 9 protein n=1 Tax=Winogradskyella sp. TaxID=1883156 RepID=UPI001B116579|nr:glycosyltransferase family 9 protein [Winogradskyella sp.]MBO6881503.1 glycosyltransferase [Winogradskyella sp.]
MLKVAFLHDVEMDFIGGAELSNKKIIDKGLSLGYKVVYDGLTDFEFTRSLAYDSDIVILNNLVKCDYEFELISFLIDNKLPTVKWEHDYGFCAKRTLFCVVDPKFKNCCDNSRFHNYRNLFANALLNVFQSPMHYGYYSKIYGQAVARHLVLPPPINVENIKSQSVKNEDEVLFLGNLNHAKGGHELIDYAIENPQLKFKVFGRNRLRRNTPENIQFQDKISNESVLKELSKSKYFFFKPRWPEASGRVAAEAFLSGNTMISNDRVGTFSYSFYPDNIDEAKKQMIAAPTLFWESVVEALENVKTSKKFNHVLVYKSYGGLGDQFIALPALNKLRDVSEQVTLAVPKGLLGVYKRNTEGFNLITIPEVEKLDKSKFDKEINLGNYPKSRRFRNVGVIDYATHNKLKQHALKHYIDAIATLHKDVDTTYNGYPYFKSQVNTEEPYFTVHPGAGFKPKWWPTERYVELIIALLNRFKQLKCVVILGPDDPDSSYFENIENVTLETGNLDAVEACLRGSSFHIGNDSGITHFAGVFNVPFVSFHGLTGPGSWSALSEHREVVWGKPGNCNIRCKYDIAINCEHRNCLTSISVNRALEAVYKLIQKSEIMKGRREKLVFNPEYTVRSQGEGFLIKSREKELFLEFKDAKERQCFESLVQNDLFSDEETTENFERLVDTLIEEALVFALPE